MLDQATVFLSRAFLALLNVGIALFVGGAWAASDVVMNAGAVLFCASGVAFALFVPLLVVGTVQAVRSANGSTQP
jgi:hypothetical protein